MSLADRLRQSLELGRQRSPDILTGDPVDHEWAVPEDRVAAAAVLVPVVDRPEPTLILTVRPATMRKHGGQIAFPGGRIDPGDNGPVAAALREAREEIGLDPALVEIIATTDRYRTITGFDVTPVIGVIPPDVALAPQPSEVEAIFEAPLDFLLRPDRQQLRTAMWRGRERSYYEIQWEDRTIWGATAAMIVNLSRRLELAP
jgi:8-oxo-dGTP pyrophosphatase MutT (NUDIX family)